MMTLFLEYLSTMKRLTSSGFNLIFHFLKAYLKGKVVKVYISRWSDFSSSINLIDHLAIGHFFFFPKEKRVKREYVCGKL